MHLANLYDIYTTSGTLAVKARVGALRKILGLRNHKLVNGEAHNGFTV